MRSICSKSLTILLTVIVVTLATASTQADVHVGQTGVGKTPLDKVDHSAWDTLLKKYVDDDGYVDYTALHGSSKDRQTLTGYLNTLSKANPSLKTTNSGRLAFWINAYNALTVHGILREYPTTSIRNHTARFFGYNIWKNLYLNVAGQGHSLEHIEHQILRKLDEPRIHFAIVCASIGCPRLLNRAYTVADVDVQLETNAKDFFSRKQNFQHIPKAGRFYLSSILDWFGEDFGSTQSTQLRRIAKWLPYEASRAAALSGSVAVSFMDYNWNLNDQKSRPKRTARR